MARIVWRPPASIQKAPTVTLQRCHSFQITQKRIIHQAVPMRQTSTAARVGSTAVLRCVGFLRTEFSCLLRLRVCILCNYKARACGFLFKHRPPLESARQRYCAVLDSWEQNFLACSGFACVSYVITKPVHVVFCSMRKIVYNACRCDDVLAAASTLVPILRSTPLDAT